jgi:hypothetical protein
VHSAVISYFVADVEIKDPNYYPYPKRVHIHDNTYTGGGTLPDATTQIGILLATATEAFPNKVVPQVLYDGITDSKITTPPENPMQICISNNGGSAFANLHLDKLDKNKPDLPGIMSLDAKPYDCSLPAIPPVTFPGL